MNFGDVLSLLLSLAAIGAVLYISYRFSKFMADKVNTISSSSNVKIHERAMLGQDKGLAVIEICEKFYLIGFSSNDISILKELDDYVPKEPTDKSDFVSALKSSMKNIGTNKSVEKDKDE